MSEFQCASAMLQGNDVKLSVGLQQLKNEHGPLSKKMDQLLIICDDMENIEQVNQMFDRLHIEVKQFFSELESHSNREEQVLFPMLEKYIGKSGPITAMEYEHEQAKIYLTNFLEKADSMEELADGKKIQYAFLVKNACIVLQDHFLKEENVLYPMAQKFFSEEEQKELLERIE